MAMTQKALISVVIPHYDQEEQLVRCLSSLVAQRGAFFLREIIVVDNNSTVRPDRACERFPHVTLLSEPRPGPGHARNRGAAHARGDVLAFIDADCFAAPGWLEAISETFRAHPEKEILGGDVRIAAKGERLTPIEAYESIFAYRMDKYIAQQGFTGTGNLAVRRETFERVGGFCGIEQAEDREWGQRASALGLTVSYVPSMVAYHPGRETFAELTRKWDRHLAHDLAALKPTRSGRARWLLRAGAVAVSPLVALPEVATSDRLRSPADRVFAAATLVRIRAYRALRMVSLLVGNGRDDALKGWNRSSA